LQPFETGRKSRGLENGIELRRRLNALNRGIAELAHV
jgi:hypothetical protein